LRIKNKITCNSFCERGGEAAPLTKRITGYLIHDPKHWSLYHFGKTLEEWRDSQKKRPQSSQKKS
ncbi:hypothetical protein, partial [Leptolyngbya sp. FACHB-16]|uniref:hypothetical protein n=1 Tax=unclassified Leptolyngbya TaxID=2650499 RepID=UPI001A7E7BC4